MKTIPFDEIDILPDLKTHDFLMPYGMRDSTNKAEVELYKTAMRVAMGKFLTPTQKDILEKHYWGGMSKTEIGRLFGMTPSSVCKKISSAIEVLRIQIEYCAEVNKTIDREGLSLSGH